MLTFHSRRALGSTYSRLHHRLPKLFNADAISSLHFLKFILYNTIQFVNETEIQAIFFILIPTTGFPRFNYMLGANLGLLLYGEVSVMII